LASAQALPADSTTSRPSTTSSRGWSAPAGSGARLPEATVLRFSAAAVPPSASSAVAANRRRPRSRRRGREGAGATAGIDIDVARQGRGSGSGARTAGGGQQRLGATQEGQVDHASLEQERATALRGRG